LASTFLFLYGSWWCPTPRRRAFDSIPRSWRSRQLRGGHCHGGVDRACNLMASAVDQTMPSLLIESMDLVAVTSQIAVPRKGHAAGGAGVGSVADTGTRVTSQIAGPRDGHAAGGAGVGAVAGMSTLATSQAAGPREGLATGGALELAPHPVLPSLARPCRAPSRISDFGRFPTSLASSHRHISLLAPSNL
jgi:hypothetical protein